MSDDRLRRLVLCALTSCAVTASCKSGDDLPSIDGGAPEAGPTLDSGPSTDSGVSVDSRPSLDSMATTDRATTDAAHDAGKEGDAIASPDAPSPDAPSPDAPSPDVAAPDVVSPDVVAADVAAIDACAVDRPDGCAEVSCGDDGLACCAGNVCHSPGTLVCYAGSCAHCGASGEPCCDSGDPCGSGLRCVVAYCQPDANALWSESFESVTWDHNGGGTLSDGIVLFDAGGPTLHTLIAPGNGSTRALGWYGGGVVAPRTVAGMTIPAVFDTTRTLTVEFDAFAGTDFDPIIILNSSGCGTSYNVTVRRMYGWQTLSRDFPSCGTMGRIVFQVGDIYEAPTSTLALRIDNIHLTYH